MRHGSVLYLGCLLRSRSSSCPWANWHFPPYLHKPLSVKDRHSSVLYRDEEEEMDEVDEEELVFSPVGLMSLWESFRSVPGQPRLAAVVLPVSTMLMERWARKPDFPHWVGSASWGGKGLSDC